MSRFSQSERDGFTKILSYLSGDDLMSLSQTVTNRMIQVEDAKEAVEAIISYSQSAEELLRRKKVHRDIIFRYLVAEKVSMPSSSEKIQLVKATLEYWRMASTQGVEETMDFEMGIKQEGLGGFEDASLSSQFCQWFFQTLNSQNPSLGGPALAWGPQHFWEDTRLELRSSAGMQQQVEQFQGAELVSQRLLALVRDESLFFSPNLNGEGLRYVSSPHGLVVVGVAGTIHRHNVCLGIFEKLFGLIRSPLNANSWKIKFVQLRIRGQDELRPGEEVKSPCLTCSPSELKLLLT